MFQEQYKAMYDGIAPDQALLYKTINGINGNGRQPVNRQRPRWRRPAVIAAAALLCVLTAMPVMAANVPVFYELLYMVSPETAQFFMPVQRSCEDNGIRMEVAATYIHGNTAEIFVTMQDLTGERIDATTDLYDSYSIHRPFNSTAHCERVGYDPETKTVTFLITITEWGNQTIEDDKLTFSVRRFISNKRHYEGIPVNIDLRALDSAPETKEVRISGSSGLRYELSFPRDSASAAARVLAGTDDAFAVVEGIDITGFGYVDNMLHIQTSVKNPLKNDNHGYFFLKGPDGSEVFYDFSVAFIEYGVPGNEETRVAYNEFVFDIPQSEISDYSLYGSFYTSGLYTEGNWRVTFPLEASWSQLP